VDRSSLLVVPLTLVLATAAVVFSQALLAYVARRDPSEHAAYLPPVGAVLLGLATGAAVLALLLGRPMSLLTIAPAVWTAGLAVIFAVDLRVRYILDIFTAPLALLALAAAATLKHPALLSALGGALIGLVIFGAFYVLGWLLFRRAAIGLGDVKLAVLLGLMLGWEHVLTAVYVGAVAGGLASVLLVALRRVKLGDAPAYGTYMALGGYVALLLGVGG
jgi:leader peptidase (prepilin peptidase)/N-methyltransferase